MCVCGVCVCMYANSCLYVCGARVCLCACVYLCVHVCMCTCATLVVPPGHFPLWRHIFLRLRDSYWSGDKGVAQLPQVCISVRLSRLIDVPRDSYEKLHAQLEIVGGGPVPASTDSVSVVEPTVDAVVLRDLLLSWIRSVASASPKTYAGVTHLLRAVQVSDAGRCLQNPPSKCPTPCRCCVLAFHRALSVPGPWSLCAGECDGHPGGPVGQLL